MPLRSFVRRTIAAAVLLAGCSDATGTADGFRVNSDLSAELPTAAPAEQGFDEAKLSMAFSLARSKPLLKSLIVVRNGFVVGEGYFGADNASTHTNVQAVTTSFMSALVGIAVQRGMIQSVDQSIADYLVPGVVPTLDASHRAITIKHLLTMTSGIQWAEGTAAESDGFAASGFTDLWRYALSKPLSDAPGTRINYNSATASLLSVVLTRATGMSTLDFARQQLLTPLGIHSIEWAKDGDYWYGGSAMRMRPRDAAKLGALYVNNGVSSNTQLVPANWVSASLTPVVANGVPYRYGPIDGLNFGFMWWIDRLGGRDAFFSWGYGGQFVYCVPALKLVIVTTVDATSLTYDTKGAIEKGLLELIFDRVLPSVRN